MGDIPPDPDLLRALGRLARGLSALFWGLPLALLIYVQTARTGMFDVLEKFAVAPALLVTALLFFGLGQMDGFQRQERVWMSALERARVLAAVNFGLVPFLHWWHRQPAIPFFGFMVLALAGSSLLLLFNLNNLLQRLAAMLPDESLRLETRMFTRFNRGTLAAIPIFIGGLALLTRMNLPESVTRLLDRLEVLNLFVLMFLIILPLAMTMALLWKIKETIFSSLFGRIS
jgi:hypothetical protein